jgi:hypothetical protein
VDRLRVVGDLTVSEMNITRVSGVALTGRDWSADFAKLQNLDIALSALRDAILSKIDVLGMLANDYDLLTIDLSTARTDALVASHVVSMCVIDASVGATYSFKFFDVSKPSLDQSILPKGACIEKLNRANVYLTNSAQSGLFLKLLIWKVV